MTDTQYMLCLAFGLILCLVFATCLALDWVNERELDRIRKEREGWTYKPLRERER